MLYVWSGFTAAAMSATAALLVSRKPFSRVLAAARFPLASSDIWNRASWVKEYRDSTRTSGPETAGVSAPRSERNATAPDSSSVTGQARSVVSAVAARSAAAQVQLDLLELTVPAEPAGTTALAGMMLPDRNSTPPTTAEAACMPRRDDVLLRMAMSLLFHECSPCGDEVGAEYGPCWVGLQAQRPAGLLLVRVAGGLSLGPVAGVFDVLEAEPADNALAGGGLEQRGDGVAEDGVPSGG